MKQSGNAEVRKTFGTLDGLRGVAAISVVILHVPFLFGPIRAPNAGLAVDLFFMMSGFIISHAYDKKFSSGMTSLEFVILRIIRLYPLYFLGLAFGVLVAIANSLFGRSDVWDIGEISLRFLAGALAIPSPPPEGATINSAFSLNPPAWSLFFEMIVNVFYAVMFFVLGIRAIVIITVLSAVVLVATFVTYGHINFGSDWENIYLGLFRTFYAFMFGCLLYRIRDKIIIRSIHPLIIMAFSVLMFASDFGEYSSFYNVVCTIFIIPVIVLFAINSEPSARLSPTFAYLGAISYAVYSLHYPIGLAAQAVARRLFGDDFNAWGGLAGVFFLIVVVVVSTLADRIYDAPVRRFLTRRRRQASVA
jgi:peptidoglycan/LPS O-acetylase OafA/YrhL